MAEYKKAIELDPYSMLPYGGLIWVYNQLLGQMDSTLYWAKRMLNFDPDNPWGNFYLGLGYSGMDELEKAREAFEKARSLSPNLLLNLNRLSQTYRILGNYEQAVEVLKKIIEINPEGSDAYYYLGICYTLMGADEMAISNYRKSLSMTESMESEHPDNPVTIIAKGIVLSRLGMIEEGMEAGKRGFEMDTTYNFDYARLLAVQQYTEEALRHLEIAIENGYRDLCWIKMDPDLSSLQNDERFLSMLDRHFN